MKRISLTLDDELVDWLHLRAEHGTTAPQTLSACVRDVLYMSAGTDITLSKLPSAYIKQAGDVRSAEGYSAYPYTDTTGHVTIGWGYNLTAKGMPESELRMMFERDFLSAVSVAHKWLWGVSLLGVHDGKTPIEKVCVIVEMAFVMGYGGLSEWVNLKAAIQGDDWSGAATEIRNSLWATQAPERVERLARQMERKGRS